MSVKLLSISPLEENYAEFENDEVSGDDQGALSWGEPFEVGSVFKVTFEGTDVEGTTISSTTIEIDEESTVNPTKVFWWIVSKATPLICPSCNNGY